MGKNFNFTTAFAMRCNAEQFESVKKEMEGMGYEMVNRPFPNGVYIVTNYAGADNCAGYSGCSNKNFQKLVIESFNRDLCLALAAMTDKPDGIVGEWFVHVAVTDKWFTKNNLYKKQAKGTSGAFIDNDGYDHGMGIDGIKQWFRKATADELIKHFAESKSEEKSEINPQIESLQKRIEDLEYNVKLLTTNMDKVIHQPEPKRYDIQTISDIINCTNESNLDSFLIDFKNVLILAHKAKAKGKKLNNAEFTWIDDGKNDILSYDIFND